MVLYKHQRPSWPLTFHPRPLVLDRHKHILMFFSEITGLFEFKFDMEYSVDKTHKYGICLGKLSKTATLPIYGNTK